ncbi:PIN domain-containing protein [Pseudoalteromonas sp. MMG005]|uniref:PIN domain-containing protein n=1 Tax=Pseudoalteromonas sp. MMG005 TaxID=2822682 RepID=UPI001B39FE86|nr:PIN domain-containing protein [Pseudoalteromonas sp. MMG005]MBQ4848341.1 DUF4935 domain-containing protein [Pseudoalteromonas sp. MMG005]
MKIFIDTNIFYNNWMLRSAYFQLLSNYVANTECKLLISDVVIKETENKYRVELDKITKELASISTKVGSFTESHFTIDMNQLPTNEYDFSTIIHSYFPSLKTISCNKVDNEKLVKKAILGKRPFRENEKGYRDAVIWHSLIDYLSENRISEDIVFITSNTSDFFVKNGNGFDLHEDLVCDLKSLNLNNKFKIYTSLKSFIKENINEELHGFIHEDSSELEERFGEVIEDEFEDFATGYMNNHTINQLKSIFLESDWSVEYLDLMKSARFEVWEGMEDPSISRCFKIEDNKIAFEYSFNLRRCTLEFMLNTDDFFVNKAGINAVFMNAETNDENTNVYRFPRSYFTGSGVFNLTTGSVEQMEIDSIWFR